MSSYFDVSNFFKKASPRDSRLSDILIADMLFSIQTVDIGIFLSPKNFSPVRISQLKV